MLCTYNRAASLRRTLDALHAQVTPVDLTWELIVVDNNSTDTTTAVIGTFVATARIRLRPLFVASQGLSHARNAGLAQSHGVIIAFTDDDVYPSPDWVARITLTMRETGAAIVGGRILPRWDHVPPQWLASRPVLRGPLAIMEHDRPAVVVNADAIPTVWGANMAFRREVFDTVGDFDPRRGMRGTTLYGGEEVDLVSRALTAGYRVVYDPQIMVWHRVPANRMRVAYFSRFYFQRAEGSAIVATPPRGLGWFGVYRSMGRRVFRYLKAVICRRADTLERWLECCAAAGTIWGFWKLALVPPGVPTRRERRSSVAQ